MTDAGATVASASVEWHAGPTALVRVHPAGGGAGSPYDAVVTAVPEPDDPSAAVLKGFVAHGEPVLSALRAVKDALLLAGFTGCRWERRGGSIRPVRWRQGRGTRPANRSPDVSDMPKDDEDRLFRRLDDAAFLHGLSFKGGEEKAREVLRDAFEAGRLRGLWEAAFPEKPSPQE